MDDLCGIEETYMLMHVEIAVDLAAKYRAGTLSRTQGHRLLDSLHAISEQLCQPPHETWVEYVGHDMCGLGCACGRQS